jgi:hypothetical protein
VSLSSSQGSASSAVRCESVANLRYDPPSQQATTPVTTARRTAPSPAERLSGAELLADMRWLAPPAGNASTDRPATGDSEMEAAEDLTERLDQTAEETCDPAAECAAPGIFDGSLFLLSPRIALPGELAAMIERGGGKVVLAPPHLADRPTDYDVRRLGAPEEGRPTSTPEAASSVTGGGGGGGGGFGRPKRQLSQSRLAVRGRVVSEYWVRKCLAVGKLLDPEVHPGDRTASRAPTCRDTVRARPCLTACPPAGRRSCRCTAHSRSRFPLRNWSASRSS